MRHILTGEQECFLLNMFGTEEEKSRHKAQKERAQRVSDLLQQLPTVNPTGRGCLIPPLPEGAENPWPNEVEFPFSAA